MPIFYSGMNYPLAQYYKILCASDLVEKVKQNIIVQFKKKVP